MVSINKTIGDKMGYNIKDAALMAAYQRQFPGADLNRLAALAGIPAADVPNYVINTTATPSKNEAYGTVTSRASENVQSANTPRTGINPITGRPFSQTPFPPVVESTDADVDFDDAYGGSFVEAKPLPTKFLTPGVNAGRGSGEFLDTRNQTPEPTDLDVDFDDAYGGSFVAAKPLPTKFLTPGTAQATNPIGSRGSGEFLDTRNQTPQPNPYPEPPPSRPARPISQVDDFSGTGVTQVDDFSEFSSVRTRSPQQNNRFGVDDFGNTEAAQFDAFGDPLRAPAPVAEFDAFGDPINPQVTNEITAEFDAFGDPIVPQRLRAVAQFDEFGDPINPQIVAEFDEFGDPIVRNDGTDLTDDFTAEFDEFGDPIGTGESQVGVSAEEQAALNAMALKQKAQQQQTVNEMREASGVKNADGDWRVKLRLAPQATYLYKDPQPGILAPLAVTDGIIFPYTPTIDIQYRAEYTNYSPTHSNYMHYFYKGSSVQTVQLQAEFTAQDTVEAEYLLAVIHFLKSASKMFYGQDAQRGSPPPLLFLSGLGEYQFNEQPCAITEFNYNLPSDVNYIRARSRHITRDDRLQFEKPLASATTNGNFSAINRLKTAVTNAFNGQEAPLQVGAKPFKPAPGNLGSKGATYVPTKMSMTINLLPIISRQAASQQFSLKEYANGNLIKKGMW